MWHKSMPQLGLSVLTSAAGKDSVSSGLVHGTSSGGDTSDEGRLLHSPARFEVRCYLHVRLADFDTKWQADIAVHHQRVLCHSNAAPL